MSDRGYYTPKSKSASKFKTPLPYSTPKSVTSERDVFYTPRKDISDSDESSASSASTGISTESGELTIAAEFDDLMRAVRQQRSSEAENVLISILETGRDMSKRLKEAVDECQRLQLVLSNKTKDLSDLNDLLQRARWLLDQEKKRSRQIEDERDQLEIQIANIRELLLKDTRSQLADETKEKLAFLSKDFDNGVAVAPQLSAIQEVNTTGSLLSDFSYSKSGDELDARPDDVSQYQDKKWKNHRPSGDNLQQPPVKKRRSSGHKVVEISHHETVRATTTLTVDKNGPITATSVIESVPKDGALPPKSPGFAPNNYTHESTHLNNKIHDIWQSTQNAKNAPRGSRQHTFQTKTLVMPDNCSVCEKRMGFGKSTAKCVTCRAMCHPECKNLLPLPCIAAVNTPTNQRGALGVIGDYTPTIPPMVPAIIVHCINEIELRGFSELGLYRVPGSERDVKNLKEKFLKRRGSPCLSQVEVPVLCSTVKDFLRSLNEPLVTRKLWKDFVHAVEALDEQDRNPALYQVISELPQPNRDTLAFIILHLKKVSESKECKMPIDNLAKMFGPTIVGYSSDDLDPGSMYSETAQQAKVMEYLLNLPSDYWEPFVDVQEYQTPSSKLQQTPSTDSLLRTATSRGFFTPQNRNTIKKKQRFFPTPPQLK